MEKFRTVKQISNVLREEEYKFLDTDKDGIDIYEDYDGRRAHVNWKNKTIDYKGFQDSWL
ncbi:hypothetical protein MOF23_22660 [Bacillus inaquosorum]|uniref:hypothetical protein n=1 Tax=Bacillus inaquosorum TaxID=483913 RepID=UPI00227ED02B|nr:hypothetical protein [Bacillus inaquosorum]MCY9311738.1 hypothetical protein [Bacillus inaquosorum]